MFCLISRDMGVAEKTQIKVPLSLVSSISMGALKKLLPMQRTTANHEKFLLTQKSLHTVLTFRIDFVKPT